MRVAVTIWLLLLSLSTKSQQIVTLCPDDRTTFTYYSYASTDGIWIWTLNSDTLSNTNNVTITWNVVGNYNIIVNFSNGCEVSEVYTVYVLECQAGLYFPNAFTPNGDGINDGWKPIGFGIKEIKWYIFDRWGLQIYEADDVEDVWDGCMWHEGKRRPCQADVYVWLCRWIDVQGKSESRTGRVTIAR